MESTRDQVINVEATQAPSPAAQAQPAANNLDTIEGWTDRKSFEADLCSTLDNIKFSGSFSTFHTARNLEPGLSIRDVGPIKLPLEEAQIRSMIAVARQAPFGKGSETVVDTSVRNTWELDPSQFELLSPSWSQVLDRLKRDVAEDMGIDVPVVADLYKLLIYEKGAMFKAHTEYALPAKV